MEPLFYDHNMYLILLFIKGDLYTWGWNTNGELGLVDDDTKIFATPKPVDFMDQDGQTFEANVKSAKCGNVFTICMLGNNTVRLITLKLSPMSTAY